MKSRAGRPILLVLAGGLLIFGGSWFAAVRESRVADPLAVRIVTDDLDRFWAVLDGPADSLAARLDREYLGRGGRALREFAESRQLTGSTLVAALREEPDRYERARASSGEVSGLGGAICEALIRFQALYPEAEFADVHLVIGRADTGGTTMPGGIVVGLEMLEELSQLVPLVAHETVHLQQPSHRRNITLLARAIREGAAVYIAELLTGIPPAHDRHAYGRAHEAELWQEFEAVMDGYETRGWMWGGAPEGRPPDLAYYLGYEIVRAFYERPGEPPAKLERILAVTYDERDFLTASAYRPAER